MVISTEDGPSLTEDVMKTLDDHIFELRHAVDHPVYLLIENTPKPVERDTPLDEYVGARMRYEQAREFARLLIVHEAVNGVTFVTVPNDLIRTVQELLEALEVSPNFATQNIMRERLVGLLQDVLRLES